MINNLSVVQYVSTVGTVPHEKKYLVVPVCRHPPEVKDKYQMCDVKKKLGEPTRENDQFAT